MLTFVVRLFKNEIVILLTLYFFDALLRLGISVIILYLLNALSDNHLREAYIYAVAILVASYLNQLARQASFVKANIFYGRLKASLGMLLYAKVSSLTNSVIKNSKLGKITNLIASDLGAIESFPVSLSIVLYPLFAIGSIVLLVLRIGWPGILGMIFAMLTSPLSYYISRYNRSII